MTDDRRLIEVNLPLVEVSAQSAREKFIRHGHISTLHIWWAGWRGRRVPEPQRVAEGPEEEIRVTGYLVERGAWRAMTEPRDGVYEIRN